MRLLNTSTLEFKEFLGTNIPEYAILSHVWSSEEVSYEDYLAGRGKDGYGYQKILNLCKFARNVDFVQALPHRELEWAWIDTCCIDKRSSAELSESINSMFNWYENAVICYVFLPDVNPLPDEQHSSPNEPQKLGVGFSEQQFLDSKWFTRGWTLQELLAPPQALFFNSSFEIIGKNLKHYRHMSFISLSDLIAEATGISLLALQSEPEHICIAQRMSWASRRVTTREEDLAYCLLGLFQVNMPLLYGEGFSRAFLRLQLEIIASSSDDSIFAWDVLTDTSLPNIHRPWSGLLAPHPRNFFNCRHVHPIQGMSINSHSPKLATYTITHRGIEMSLPISFRAKTEKMVHRVLYPLMCANADHKRIHLKIWIQNIPEFEETYADGALLAWRSGCITSSDPPPAYYSSDDEDFTYYSKKDLARENRLQSRLQSAFCGSRKSKRTKLTAAEATLCSALDLYRTSIPDSVMKFPKLLVARGLDKGPWKGTTLQRLYFKTAWREGETPDKRYTFVDRWSRRRTAASIASSQDTISDLRTSSERRTP